MADPFMVWNPHKAFIRGVLIQLGSQEKKRRLQHLDSIISSIKDLKTQNQSILKTKLVTLRQELTSLLLEIFERMQLKLKATSYSTSNKARKAMVQRIKGRRAEARIA